jgi:hypothetical protein
MTTKKEALIKAAVVTFFAYGLDLFYTSMEKISNHYSQPGYLSNPHTYGTLALYLGGRVADWLTVALLNREIRNTDMSKLPFEIIETNVVNKYKGMKRKAMFIGMESFGAALSILNSPTAFGLGIASLYAARDNYRSWRNIINHKKDLVSETE